VWGSPASTAGTPLELFTIDFYPYVRALMIAKVFDATGNYIGDAHLPDQETKPPMLSLRPKHTHEPTRHFMIEYRTGRYREVTEDVHHVDRLHPPTAPTNLVRVVFYSGDKTFSAEVPDTFPAIVTMGGREFIRSEAAGNHIYVESTERYDMPEKPAKV
jgi:hypothetical protein